MDYVLDLYHLVNVYITMEHHHRVEKYINQYENPRLRGYISYYCGKNDMCLMDILLSWQTVSHYQRVIPINIPIVVGKIP